MALVLEIKTKPCDIMQFLLKIQLIYIITDKAFIVLCTYSLKPKNDFVRGGHLHMKLDGFSGKFLICNNQAPAK